MRHSLLFALAPVTKTRHISTQIREGRSTYRQRNDTNAPFISDPTPGFRVCCFLSRLFLAYLHFIKRGISMEKSLSIHDCQTGTSLAEVLYLLHSMKPVSNRSHVVLIECSSSSTPDTGDPWSSSRDVPITYMMPPPLTLI